MEFKHLLRYGAVILTVAMFFLSSQAQQKASDGKGLSIEGTYMLVSRDLSGGSVVKSPDVAGMMTYTKKYRNFNVSWKTPQGKHISIAYVAEYTLTAEAYKEIPIYWMWFDESQGMPNYTWPADKVKHSPVTVKDGKISFKINGEPVSVTFDGPNMTAVAAGEFTDHWKKID